MFVIIIKHRDDIFSLTNEKASQIRYVINVWILLIFNKYTFEKKIAKAVIPVSSSSSSGDIYSKFY